jgi:hypothetical protein
MYKQTITYLDYNDQEVTRDFYFNLNKAEIARMQYSGDGSFIDQLREAISLKDPNAFMRFYDKMIRAAYGKKSPDGQRFMKSDEITREFVECPAYDQLFFELLHDDVRFANFFNGLMPKGLMDEAEKLIKEGKLPELIKEGKLPEGV